MPPTRVHAARKQSTTHEWESAGSCLLDQAAPRAFSSQWSRRTHREGSDMAKKQTGQELDARPTRAIKPRSTTSTSMPTEPAAASPRLQGSDAATANVGKSVGLLSGGNPQIAKAEGDAPVQAYIDALPGWKHEVGQLVDEIIVDTAPNVAKAVKWNSPLYGIDGNGWFVGVHALTRYMKVTFFRGTSLDPVPPGGTPKSKDSRWIDIYEVDNFDAQQFAMWVRQAAALPGWVP
jgi:hypothetical protein